MRLHEYQWSRNPRGLHNSNPPMQIEPSRFFRMKCGWAKVNAIGGEQIPATKVLIGNGVTPIVRIYRDRPGASAPDAEWMKAFREYISVGVRWFELYNEPNFEIEWPVGSSFSYADIPGTIAPMMESWLNWAEFMIAQKCYPAFPALGEQTNNVGDVTAWLQSMMTYLADNHYERFRNIADNGMWVATHPYYYNHFYQEAGSPLKARPPEEQKASEGGWHFEYPFDPLTQSFSPGLTTVSGPPKHPRGDPISLIGMGHAFLTKFNEMFGGGAVPVIGTEGGLMPRPSPGGYYQADNRFPGFSYDSHAEVTLAAFEWMAKEGPPWLFGLTLWIEHEYFEGPGGELPVINRLQNTPPIYKNVPPIEALDGPGPGYRIKAPKLPGPGPIHGTPDYHFVVMAPGFNTNWFFGEAQDYWQLFRPALVSTTDYIAYLPPEKSLACTVLATPELVDYMKQHIQQRWPNVWFDLIVSDNVQKIAEILHQRVESGRRFG